MKFFSYMATSWWSLNKVQAPEDTSKPSDLQETH